jgi:hypothetical protein
MLVNRRRQIPNAFVIAGPFSADGADCRWFRRAREFDL